jgi:hypothetical protein
MLRLAGRLAARRRNGILLQPVEQLLEQAAPRRTGDLIDVVLDSSIVLRAEEPVDDPRQSMDRQDRRLGLSQWLKVASCRGTPPGRVDQPNDLRAATTEWDAAERSPGGNHVDEVRPINSDAVSASGPMIRPSQGATAGGRAAVRFAVG